MPRRQLRRAAAQNRPPTRTEIGLYIIIVAVLSALLGFRVNLMNGRRAEVGATEMTCTLATSVFVPTGGRDKGWWRTSWEYVRGDTTLQVSDVRCNDYPGEPGATKTCYCDLQQTECIARFDLPGLDAWGLFALFVLVMIVGVPAGTALLIGVFCICMYCYARLFVPAMAERFAAAFAVAEQRATAELSRETTAALAAVSAAVPAAVPAAVAVPANT